MSDTETTLGAREHARAQAGVTVEAMPVIPASSFATPPAGVQPAQLTWAETIAAGGYSTKVLSRGTTLRLTDLHGEACAHVLLYNADQSWERLNVADSVKIPWQAYMTAGHPLLSDQGRILATLVSDTAEGRHDALCGGAPASVHAQRYGDGSVYGPTPASRELFKLAGAKHDLDVRDLPPSVAFFKRLVVDEAGNLQLDTRSRPGGYVELRAELPLIVLIANAPHRLDTRPEYTNTALGVLAWSGEPTRPGDPLWTSTPELQRALLNSFDYANARGIA